MSKRNNHALRQERLLNRRNRQPESILSIARNEYSEPAKPIFNMDRLHDEALRMHQDFIDEREADRTYLLWGGDEPVAEWEWVLLGYGDADSYGRYLSEFHDLVQEREEYQDEMEREVTGLDAEEHWLPYLGGSMEACREVFGGTDFTIIGVRAPRRSW